MPLGGKVQPQLGSHRQPAPPVPLRARAPEAFKPEGRAGDALASSWHYLWGCRERRQSLSSAWTGT